MAKTSTPKAELATNTEPQLATKRFIIAVSEQGSVGKSFFLTSLAHYLSVHPGMPKVAIYETDEKPTLKSFYPDTTKIDLTETRQLDQIFVGLSNSDVSLVDGMAGVFTRIFKSWGEEVLFFEAARQIGAAITFVLVVDDNLKYIAESHRILEATPPDVEWLIVQNHHTLQPTGKKELTDWLESENRKRFLSRGAQEITLDRLEDRCRDLVQRFHHAPGELAATNPLGLNLMDHNRFVRFSRDLYAQLDTCTDLLLPPAVAYAKQPAA